MTALLACLCGGIGAGLRYLLDTTVGRVYKGRWPLGTLLINIIACFFAGLVAALAARLALPSTTHLLLATGLLGGFSTFSTAMNDVVSRMHDGRVGLATIYLLTTILVTLVLTAAGFAVGMSI
ncbi:putative fluoride ion transporter CrcB 3 [Bombiscardovia nodaiensis]|uniref:Fluoride-specific ion channel FluC n=1 Tax=Bombiscardovia nodaiensis TaxID=2932181 RepID=A0ABM8B8H9_9BIFI|nr:putative fluoride ion transporter CrcB 3 [Bombiscardovia nodaiensis]